jgi:hypothetical protein
MCDSQNAYGEKVRWGKNLNTWVGLSVGFLSFVTEQSRYTELSKVSKSVFTLFNLSALAPNLCIAKLMNCLIVIWKIHNFIFLAIP